MNTVHISARILVIMTAVAAVFLRHSRQILVYK
jgi:hypothetical protein